MNKALIAGLTVVAATALSACGSSGGSPSAHNSSPNTAAASTPPPAAGGSGAAAVKAAIKAEILASQASSATNPFKMNASQADCTANAIVDAVGVDKLRAYGLLNADGKVTGKKFNAARFSTADATVVVNGIFNCVGDNTFAAAMRHSIEAGFASKATAAQRACLESKLTVAAMKRVIIAEISGQTAAVTQLTTAIEACMVH